MSANSLTDVPKKEELPLTAAENAETEPAKQSESKKDLQRPAEGETSVTKPSDEPSKVVEPTPDKDKEPQGDQEEDEGDWTSDHEPDRPEQRPRGRIKPPVSGIGKPRPK
ncbi:hypothetical protein GYMLUDRAFT_35959 [Collybiopsis luxurians FD-317 M1]|nr:hypothetical protein GYMLUDRAFT_35959 [Collybiopsis luxurians FD-317 M1]